MAAKRFPVEAGHILLFARSIGDPNPIYADEAYARGTECGGIIAPPTFAIASAQFDDSYPLRPQPGAPWLGSGREPTSRPPSATDARDSRGLHAEQHFEYHRTMRAGDVLSATTRPGRSWEKEGRRGGKLLFSETITEYRDQEGELVVTTRTVGVLPERVVEKE
ncbi:MAG TPA: MaoC family dehydratase N-terminal domain-containing protein [Myxococcota bacterium]|nr:MaoC family dehydratase N-terminal domain-containing protein [Myxococcota bacterium]